MAEGLVTTDGQPVAGVAPAGEAEFAAMMAGAARAADAEQPEMPAPPKRDPDAPFGRTKDGKPKAGPGGRPPKARVAEPPKQSGDKPRDYSQDLAELTDTLWYGMAQLPPTKAQAAILRAHQPSLVNGLNTAAQNSAMVRGWLDASENVTWGLVVLMAVGPFVMDSIALWTRSPEQLAEMQFPSKAELAARTDEALAEKNRQIMAMLQEQGVAA